MNDRYSLDQVARYARHMVEVSGALFGFFFERTSDGTDLVRGSPLYGLITDEAVLRRYYETVGKRVLESLKQKRDEATPVVAPDDGPGATSWLAVLLTQKVMAGGCVALIYRFYDRDEAMRTLSLAQRIFMPEDRLQHPDG